MMKRILVIDDEEGVRDSFELALDTDYEVETASNGEEGLERARAERPDLVFLDLRMPGISGVETLRELHQLYADINVCIVTGFYEEYMRELIGISDEGMRFQVAKKPIGRNEIQLIAASQLEGPQVCPNSQES
jgi:CheY-like chemotaxis protein